MPTPALVPPPLDAHVLSLIRMAVGEDLGREGHAVTQAGGGGLPAGDITAELAIPADATGRARIVARKEGVISGTYLIEAILREYSAALRCEISICDGSRVGPPD